MKLGIVKRITRDDIKGKDVPEWLDQLLVSLNQFIEQVGVALQGKLTFDDNFFAKTVTQTLVHNVELEINPNVDGNIRKRVLGVLPISSETLLIDGFNWNEKSNGNIGVSAKYVSGTSAIVRLLILFQ